MKNEITKQIQELEEKRKIRVLYACESGSRAWGFPSPDSDFDVRCIYVHPVEWYLSITPEKDSFEETLPGDLDVAGWDLRKTLGLVRKSNAVVWEWLQSPIVYQEQNSFATQLLKASAPRFSLRAGLHHYLSMTERGLEEVADSERVRVKKYFYILRPLLAAYWICTQKSVPPMTLEGLLEGLSGHPEFPEFKNAKKVIVLLVERKAHLKEKDTIEREPVIESFIQQLRQICLEAAPKLRLEKSNPDQLDEFLRHWVLEKK